MSQVNEDDEVKGRVPPREALVPNWWVWILSYVHWEPLKEVRKRRDKAKQISFLSFFFLKYLSPLFLFYCISSQKCNMALMNLFAGEQQRCRCTGQTCRHTGGEEGGTNWENCIERNTLPYVKWITSGNLLSHTGSLNPVLCDNLEG